MYKRQGQCHHDDGGAYEPVSLTTLMDAPSLLRYMKWMREEFIPRYNKFKDDCTIMEVSAAREDVYKRQVKGSLLGVAEPASACILSAVLLGTSFTGADWLGLVLMIAMLVIMSRTQQINQAVLRRGQGRWF